MIFYFSNNNLKGLNHGCSCNTCQQCHASNPTPPTETFAKPLPDVSKVEVLTGQNFCRWQEHVHTLLDMHRVVFTLSTPKPDAAIDANQLQQWFQANKVCRHTLLSALALVIGPFLGRIASSPPP